MLAGFARLDVTPPLGTPVAGYFKKRYAEGILDPIEINAVAFNDGENTSLIVIADFVGIRQERVAQIKSLIEAELGVPANNIFIAATHTHTAIGLTTPDFSSSNTSGSYLEGGFFVEIILRKFVDTARLAIADMRAATFSVGEAQTKKQVSFVRRFLMKNGQVRSFPKQIPDPDIVRAMGEPDNTLRLVRINREGAKDIAIANFPTHPDTTAGCLFSADWPGHSRRYFEAENPNAHCLMLIGPQGDTNHIDVTKEGTQYGPEFSRSMGRVIADAINEAWNSATPVNTDKIAADARVVYNRTRTDGLERYEESKKFLDDYYAKRIKAHAQEIAAARRVVDIKEMPIFRTIPVSAMKLGDIAFVGFGGEAFTEYANRLRDSNPDKFVISITCCNGHQGYLPTRSAYEDGGYEAGGSAFSITIEEEVVGEAIDILNKLYE